jgi:hypothetical protein
MSTPQPVTHVSTITDLRAYTGSSDDEAIILDAYHVDSTVGGGVFHWNAGSTTADDGGIHIRPNSVAAGRWVRQIFNGSIAPEMFGAFGDGASDDTAAINSALSYVRGRGSRDGVLGYGSYALSGTLFVETPGYGFRLYLRSIKTRAEFPEPADWRSATPMIDVGTNGAGAPVGIEVCCDFVDGGSKADWLQINEYGAGGSRFHAGRLQNVIIGFHAKGQTFTSSSNQISGDYWKGGFQGVRCTQLDGGTARTEGTRINVGFITAFKYGGIHLAHGSQFSEVIAQADFNGRNVLFIKTDAPSFAGLGRGAAVSNGTNSGEVLIMFRKAGTYYVMAGFSSGQSSDGSFAAGDMLTSGDWSATATAISLPGSGDVYPDVLHDFDEVSFAKCIIKMPYAGGVRGGKMYSSDIQWYHSTQWPTNCINGKLTQANGNQLSDWDFENYRELVRHTNSIQSTQFFNHIRLGDRALNSDLASATLPAAVWTTIREFAYSASGQLETNLANVYMVTISSKVGTDATSGMLIVRGTAARWVELGNSGVFSVRTSGTALQALSGVSPSTEVYGTFLRLA